MPENNIQPATPEMEVLLERATVAIFEVFKALSKHAITQTAPNFWIGLVWLAWIVGLIFLMCHMIPILVGRIKEITIWPTFREKAVVAIAVALGIFAVWGMWGFLMVGVRAIMVIRNLAVGPKVFGLAENAWAALRVPKAWLVNSVGVNSPMKWMLLCAVLNMGVQLGAHLGAMAWSQRDNVVQIPLFALVFPYVLYMLVSTQLALAVPELQRMWPALKELAILLAYLLFLAAILAVLPLLSELVVMGLILSLLYMIVFKFAKVWEVVNRFVLGMIESHKEMEEWRKQNEARRQQDKGRLQKEMRMQWHREISKRR